VVVTDAAFGDQPPPRDIHLEHLHVRWASSPHEYLRLVLATFLEKDGTKHLAHHDHPSLGPNEEGRNFCVHRWVLVKEECHERPLSPRVQIQRHYRASRCREVAAPSVCHR
jgi:hypothetical protein